MIFNITLLIIRLWFYKIKLIFVEGTDCFKPLTINPLKQKPRILCYTVFQTRGYPLQTNPFFACNLTNLVILR